MSKEDYKDLIYEEIMLYHSDEAAFEYIKNKRQHPEGCLHQRFGHRYRKAFRTGENGANQNEVSDSDSG